MSSDRDLSQASAAAPAQEAVLRGLVDRAAIHDLLSRYCLCMDNGHFAELAALFTVDGTWNGVTGHDAIAARLAERIPMPEEGPRRIHFLSNIILTIDGSSATAQCNWLVVRASAAGPILGAAGNYIDRLEKHDGAWLFRRRDITETIAGDLGLKC